MIRSLSLYNQYCRIVRLTLFATLLLSSISWRSELVMAVPTVAMDSGFATGGNLSLNNLSLKELWGWGPVADAAAYADGRYIVAWGAGFNPSVETNFLNIVRYTKSGSIDPTFNGGKQQSIDVSKFPNIPVAGQASSFLHVRPLSSGKTLISVGYWATNGVIYTIIFRLDAAGQPDLMFANQNVTLLLQAPNNMEATLVTNLFEQSDNRIVITGVTVNSGVIAPQCIVAKYSADGVPDPSFNNGVMYLSDPANNNGQYCRVSALTPRGGVLFATTTKFNSKDTATIFALNSAGQLDTTFGGSTGKIVIPAASLPNSSDPVTVTDLAMQGTKLLVLSTYSYKPDVLWRQVTSLIRLNPDGGLDTSFGDGGLYLEETTKTTKTYKVRVLRDGNIVLAAGDLSSQQIRFIDRDGKAASAWFSNPIKDVTEPVVSLADGGSGATGQERVMALGYTRTSVSGTQSDNLVISSYLVPFLPLPWQNPLNRFDVDGDGLVTPLDVKVEIAVINTNDTPRLGIPPLPPQKYYYVDVNGDGLITPLDVLQIITYLNNLTLAGAAEGESNSVNNYFNGQLRAGSLINYYNIKPAPCPAGISGASCVTYQVMNETLGEGTFLVANYRDSSSQVLKAPLYDWAVSGSQDSAAYKAFSTELNALVVKLTGNQITGTYNFSENEGATSKRAISWQMKAGSNIQIAIKVETTEGPRTLTYSAASQDQLGLDSSIHHSLGNDFSSGSWGTFSRHLEKDLQDAQPGVFLTKINSFTVSSASELYGIKLEDAFLPAGGVEYNANNPGALSKIPAEQITSGDFGQVFLQNGYRTVLGADQIPVDTSLTYDLSGLFKSLGQNPAVLSYGLALYDAKGSLITSAQVLRQGNAVTLKSLRGSTISTKERIKAWNAANRSGRFKSIGFYFDGNTNKAPDYILIRDTAEKSTLKQGAYKTLKANSIELNVNLPASVKKQIVLGKTKIMNHYSSGQDYLLAAASGASVPSKWTLFQSGPITGEAFGATAAKTIQHFSPGTKSARLVLVLNSNPSQGQTIAFNRLRFGPSN